MMKNISGLSLDKVAERMRTTELNVLMHIKRGLLNGEELDGKWYVSEESLAGFMAALDQGKKPVVCKTGHCGKGCGSCS